MEPFNLAEAKILERKYCERNLNKRVRGVLALAAVAVLIAGGTPVLRNGIRTRTMRIRAQLSVLQKSCRSSTEEIEAAELVSRNYEWTERLVGGTRRLVSVIDCIAQCAPSDVWLSRVEVSDKTHKVSAEGSAASYESLSSFTSTLRRGSGFSDVRLSSTGTSGVGATQVVEFSVQLQPAFEDSRTNQAGSPNASRVPSIGEAL